MLDKCIAMLDVAEARASSATDLARELGMTVSTAHRLAAALVAHGFLARDPAGLHRPGPRLSTTGLTEIARPVLEQLTRDTGETTQVWVRRGGERLVVASVESSSELLAVVRVGRSLPLAAGGSAATVLTAPPSADGPSWVESISSRTAGVASVSAPVVVDGQVLAAVCLVGPVSRLQPGPGALHGDRTAAAAHAISTGLELRSARAPRTA
ncbi:IclR family transcriptional regulator domain-containing protein [Kineococcus sp. SYSU DK001]|uniref:IclR family transcriptional regulator domain-containing protein n=1 Tax=Kineococcus sp. SYSU DK001 TaxID=3383122 RepID=UPI003D7DFFC0